MTFTSRWLAAVGARPADGVSPAALDAAQAQLGITFPVDYRDVMQQADGGDADFGNSWLVLNSLESMLERNRNQELMQFFPGLTFFGTDGGGEGYAWDWQTRHGALYVNTPFIGNFDENTIACGNSFEEFLSIIHAGIPFNKTGGEAR